MGTETASGDGVFFVQAWAVAALWPQGLLEEMAQGWESLEHRIGSTLTSPRKRGSAHTCTPVCLGVACALHAQSEPVLTDPDFEKQRF